jgi:hypothetical protein
MSLPRNDIRISGCTISESTIHVQSIATPPFSASVSTINSGSLTTFNLVANNLSPNTNYYWWLDGSFDGGGIPASAFLAPTPGQDYGTFFTDGNGDAIVSITVNNGWSPRFSPNYFWCSINLYAGTTKTQNITLI